MNIITHDMAYSLYPFATFELRDALVVNRPVRADEALAKYAARGWRVLKNACPHLVRPSPGSPLILPGFFIHACRHSCDSMSWNIPLDSAGVTSMAPVPRSLSRPLERLQGNFNPGYGWSLFLFGHAYITPEKYSLEPRKHPKSHF